MLVNLPLLKEEKELIKIQRLNIISDIIDKKEIRIFEFDDRLGKFKEIERIDKTTPLYELLDSESILIFIDPKRKRVWMWIGKSSSTRMRFTATQDSYRIRDHYAFGSKISTIDEDNEVRDFKIFAGLMKEEEDIEGPSEPQYKGTPEDLKIFESMPEEKILLILKNAVVPEGYERGLVIVNNDIYLYKEFDNSLGGDIKQSRLFHLMEEVEDGPYLLGDYTPRILFSFNKILLVDVLHKIKVKVS